MKEESLFNYIIVLSAGIGIYLAMKRLFSIRIYDISEDLMKSGEWRDRPVKPTDITIHHAASANTATPYDFARWHVVEKGWPGIGYHFVIDRGGLIFQTNPVMKYTYHNGYNNKDAIGICLVGNMDREPMTEGQRKALIQLIAILKRKYPIQFLNGHREYEGETACPGRYTNEDYFRQITGIKKRVTGRNTFSLIANKYDYGKQDN